MKTKRYSVSENCITAVIGISIGLVLISFLMFCAIIKHTERTDYYKQLLSDTRAELVEVKQSADDWKIEAYKAQNQLKELGYEE